MKARIKWSKAGLSSENPEAATKVVLGTAAGRIADTGAEPHGNGAYRHRRLLAFDVVHILEKGRGGRRRLRSRDGCRSGGSGPRVFTRIHMHSSSGPGLAAKRSSARWPSPSRNTAPHPRCSQRRRPSRMIRGRRHVEHGGLIGRLRPHAAAAPPSRLDGTEQAGRSRILFGLDLAASPFAPPAGEGASEFR